MSIDNNVPEIRFTGFSGDWAEKQLNKEVEFFSGLTYSPKDIRKEGVFVIRSSNVKNGQIVKADNVYVNPEVVNCSNVKKGDIIVVVRNGSRSLIGKHAQVSSYMDQTVIGAFMTGVRGKQPEFINALFDTNQFKAQVEKNLGATINQITNGAFNSMFFLFPEALEQIAIGNTFQKIDSLIKQHQQKHDKLSNIKKAMLEKMFPKEDETVPEVRFKGFSGEWVEVSLTDLGTSTSGTSIESEFAINGKYKVVSIGSYSENSVYSDQGIRANLSSKTEGRVLNKNDLTMILNDKTLAGNIIGRVLLINEGDSYVYNQRTQRIEPSSEYEPQFLYQFLNAPLVRKKIFKSSQGNTQIYVNWSAISKLKYLIPKKEEQTAIGNYFQKLDALINQHQQQITKLNNVKQSCLSKMFV